MTVTREKERREGRAKEAAKNPLEREEQRTHVTPKPLNPAGKEREKDSIILTNRESTQTGVCIEKSKVSTRE